MTQFSAKQDAALMSVKRWIDGGASESYRLFGFAGSGKTTLAKHFAEGIDGEVLYAAFTGKAANVLQNKGCKNATTIHKLIYKPSEKSKVELNRLREELDGHTKALTEQGKTAEEIAADPQVQQIQQLLAFEEQKHKRLSFTLNPDSPVRNCGLLIVDEVSMVDEIIGRDLESFNIPLLVLGDPAQLPPVMGTGYFTNQQPHTLLDEVHRQARGNPVLRLATDVREGRGLTHGVYGSSRVIKPSECDKDEILAFDQVLVGTNKRRNGTNARMRQLLGRDHPLPMGGDRLVCLRNNHDLGLLNGGLWDVDASTEIDGDTIQLELKSVDDDRRLTTAAHTHYFLGNTPPFWAVKDYDAFDYGNALTVHKSQGSQWRKVYIFDESRVFRQDARKHLYTAITRASDEVVVVMD